MGKTSASEMLHTLLMQEDVGYKFTKDSLKIMGSDAGLDEISEGAITGFIHRAVRFGHVQFAGKVVGEHRRMLHQYEIIDRESWAFKPPSKGSPKGRTIGERHYQEVPENQIKAGEQLKLVFSDDTPAPVESLYMRLFDLAAEVETLEKKSLKDYSTDELIAELKTRIIK